MADPTVSALQLACRLHPTPAVCGFPTDRAKRHLIVLADDTVDLARMRGQPVFHKGLGFGARPVGRLVFQDLDVRALGKSLLVAFQARDLRRLADRALEDDDIALATDLVEHGLGFHVAGNRVVGADIGRQKIGVHAGVGADDGDAGVMRCLNRGCGSFDIDRDENDRVEFLRDHRVDLFLLDERVVAAIEDRQVDVTVLDGGMFFQRCRPDLHEFGIEAIRGRANLQLLLLRQRRRGEKRGCSSKSYK